MTSTTTTDTVAATGTTTTSATAAPASATAARPDRLGARTRIATLAGVGALIVLGLAWELWLAPTGQRTLAIKVVPLLLPLPGLMRNRLYTYRWLSLMVWLYFIEGVVRASSDRGAGAALGGLEIVLCLALFAACASHVRAVQRATRTAA